MDTLPKTVERDVFFQLPVDDQRSLRLFQGVFSTTFGVQFLLAPDFTTNAWSIFGFALNVFVLYGSLFISHAPNFYFCLIPWQLVFLILIDGLGIVLDWPFLIASSIDPTGAFVPPTLNFITVKTFISALNVIVAGVFARRVIGYWQMVRKAKKDSGAQTAETG